MEVIFTLCYIITFIGAINLGLVGLFKLDLVAAISGVKFGETSSRSRLIYGLGNRVQLWGYNRRWILPSAGNDNKREGMTVGKAAC